MVGKDLKNVLRVTFLSFGFNAFFVFVLGVIIDSWSWWGTGDALVWSVLLQTAVIQGLVSFFTCSLSTSANFFFARRRWSEAYVCGVLGVSLFAVFFSFVLHTITGSEKTLLPLVWALMINLFLSFVIVSGCRDAEGTIGYIPSWLPNWFRYPSITFIRGL